jgi:hypothetical protein
MTATGTANHGRRYVKGCQCDRCAAARQYAREHGKSPDVAARRRQRDRERRERPAVQEANRERARDYQRNLPPEVRQANNLRTSHGITPAEKQAMLDAQGGRCYLCGDELAYDEAVIDHDHACCRPIPTRRGMRTISCSYCRRGLACETCNIIIGMVRDDPERLIRIARNLTVVLRTARARMESKPQQIALDFPEAS